MYVTFGISWPTFLRITASLMLLIGLIALALNLTTAAADRHALRDSVRVIAEVTQVEVVKSSLNRDRETLVTPTVIFSTDEGAEVTTTLPPGRGVLSYSVGDLVAVYYDRAEPSTVRVEGDVTDPYVAIFLSALAVVAGVALFVVAFRIRRAH